MSGKSLAWLTPDLIGQKRHLKFLHRQARSGNTSEKWLNYKKAKNQYNRLIKKSKRIYYEKSLHSHSGNIKQTWKTINEILNKSSNRNKSIEIKAENGEMIDGTSIPDTFNNYFVQLGETLAREIPQSNVSPMSFLNDINPAGHAFPKFHEIAPNEVQLLLQNMNTNKASGIDGISAKILKIAAPCISSSLTLIFNQSILTGVFPNDWKTSKVIPIYKSEAKDEMTNYRPISIISTVASIFEKLIYNQIYEYLNNHDLLTNSQHGFRPFQSTVTALLDITNKWYQNIDIGKVNGVIFLDLKKAFDTVDHGILLDKIQSYGIKGSAHSWLTSYLLNRTQYCYVNGNQSGPLMMKTGIPQGSGLGPLLFLIYINDLPCCLQKTEPHLFADDTQIATASDDINEIVESLSDDLSNIANWLSASKLTLNKSKTEYMLIGSKKRLSQLISDQTINVGDFNIKRVKKTKSLGLCIDESLSWNAQIDHITTKVTSALASLRQVRDTVDFPTLIVIYKSLIQPYFDYCAQIWGCLGATLSNKVQKLQNRAFRIITRESYTTRSIDILSKLNIPNLEQRRNQQLSVLMYKINKKLAPDYMRNIFTNTCDIHNHNTRQSDVNLVLPKPRTNYMKCSFGYRGAENWNALPISLKKSENISIFKSLLRCDTR